MYNQNLVLGERLFKDQVLTQQEMKLPFSEVDNGNVLRMIRINTNPETVLCSLREYGAGSVGQWCNVCLALVIHWCNTQYEKILNKRKGN